MMTALTTRQRDILQLLVESNEPLGSADLAGEMDLTSRQVNYGLKGLRAWLEQRDVTLKVTPGVGAQLVCSPEKCRELLRELATDDRFQLVLSVEERQQLIALILLVADEPLILYQLQQLTEVSRTTILKDIESIEPWIQSHGLSLERRPNYGFEIRGAEGAFRQALSALLWGQTPLGKPLIKMAHAQGLIFELGTDANLMPIVAKVRTQIKRWDVQRTFGQVTYAEAQLNGRFTDDAVLDLALNLAVQTDRVQAGNIVLVQEQMLNWLQTLNIWAVATQIAKHLGWRSNTRWPETEIAYIAMHFLAAPRNDRWPGDLEIDNIFTELIDELVACIVNTYGLPHLALDKTLRDGLVIHIIPACLRHRFNLWTPHTNERTELSGKYGFERKLAIVLAGIIEQRTAVVLPENEINNIALLLRAAYIREHPNLVQEVIIVCPSGMATAQLLVARLKARFPRLGTLRVVSLRELNQKMIESAELIITTVPLTTTATDKQNNIIQVHPLLLPEDVEKITQWLA
ncbi:MAG: PRD domain-containing protein [Anaerolineae bacterium]|nr:PRD domain-containing protein [Anaerolineae bacterium]